MAATADLPSVLHVISGMDPETGGPAVALIGLAAAQAQAGLRVGVAATYQDPRVFSFLEPLRRAGVELHMIGPARGKLSRHPQIVPRLRELIGGVNCVHIHALWEEIQHQAAVIARRLGVPYLVTPHGMLDPWSLAQRALVKRLYLAWRLRRDLNEAAAVHYTSETEAALVGPLRLRSSAIVEPNGIDLAEFSELPPRGAFRAKYPLLAGGRLMILFLGRLHYKKGFDLLIPAVARMRNRDAVLVLAGPDADGYRAEIERMIDAAGGGMSDRVIFTGMLRGEERVEAYRDADLFVLPSYQENFGIAVVEALAAGTPVVISDQVNIHQEIASAGVGGVVPTKADALAQELARWLGHTPLRAAAAERARPFVWQNYNWDQIARRWGERYQTLVRHT